MHYRPDISDVLVHFTKGDTEIDAFENLRSIIKGYCLKGGTGMIKGGFKCVCFSEAPLAAIKEGLVNQSNYSKYSQFGIMLSKKWLFEKGGRPVIYQSEIEFNQLNENAWRHVTYEPNLENPIDFTWEREWRINTDKLEIGEDMSQIVVPNKEWADLLIETFHWEAQEYNKREYELIYDDPLMAELMAGSNAFHFYWDIIAIES